MAAQWPGGFQGESRSRPPPLVSEHGGVPPKLLDGGPDLSGSLAEPLLRGAQPADGAHDGRLPRGSGEFDFTT